MGKFTSSLPEENEAFLRHCLKSSLILILLLTTQYITTVVRVVCLIKWGMTFSYHYWSFLDSSRIIIMLCRSGWNFNIAAPAIPHTFELLNIMLRPFCTSTQFKNCLVQVCTKYLVKEFFCIQSLYPHSKLFTLYSLSNLSTVEALIMALRKMIDKKNFVYLSDFVQFLPAAKIVGVAFEDQPISNKIYKVVTNHPHL